MAFLFEVNGRSVFPNPETLLISPYKEIWARDTDVNKEFALEEMAYIEFMGSMKKSNPFSGYDASIRGEKVRDAVITTANWSPDTLVIQGIKRLEKLQTEASVSYSFLMAARKAAETIKDFFNTVDLNERNEKSGTPIYKPKDVTSAINDAEKIIQNLDAIQKKVEQDMYESTKTKADKQISAFANPDSL